MIRLQVSAAADSQPIGLAGRRRVSTSPTVAYPSGKPTRTGALCQTLAVSGRDHQRDPSQVAHIPGSERKLQPLGGRRDKQIGNS